MTGWRPSRATRDNACPGVYLDGQGHDSAPVPSNPVSEATYGYRARYGVQQVPIAEVAPFGVMELTGHDIRDPRDAVNFSLALRSRDLLSV
jgi:hypothetical protein